MKSKAHGKKCQAMGVSESSVEEPESEETGTREGMERHLTCFPSAVEKHRHTAGRTVCETL